ncbi:hypothetical protein KGF54_002238 [Candida jiufengensis]|uniref:uncharacterized protein n=1 Tax=Candida jiufengensis TaxID=497108 RepID=UPI0022255DE9|nr:uncharacterized protein KGF54_002238 [Candida jiufengensis]KAI5954463.1 hypothetical protein KGF54_002238 [Candida jiufengensis]
MSLADGEYEIDISVLLNETNNNSDDQELNEYEDIAIRYGFIPDSMDQSKPLKLYKHDQSYILQASSSEPNKKPILFEGSATRHNDSEFYFTYDEESIDNLTLKLSQLDSTIRFNKSRDTLKLQSEIKLLEKEFEKQQHQLQTLQQQKAAIAKNPEQQRLNKFKKLEQEKSELLKKSEQSKWEQKKKEQQEWEEKKLEHQKLELKKLELQKIEAKRREAPQKPVNKQSPTKPSKFTNTKSTKSPIKKEVKSSTLHIPSINSKVASKRPPTATSTPEPRDSIKESIISESDFDDLKNDSSDDDDQIKFPEFTIAFDESKEEKAPPKKKAIKVVASEIPKNESKGLDEKSTIPTRTNNSAPKPQIHTANDSKPQKKTRRKESMVDEFDELENQLQEVLEFEEEVPKEDNAMKPKDTILDKESAENVISTSTTSMRVTKNSNNSDSDMDDSDFDTYNFGNNNIKIDEGVNHRKSNSFSLNVNSQGKPRSLRELMGGGKKSITKAENDGSSSEEE